MPVQRMRIISSTTAPLTAPSAPSTSCCKRVPCWRICAVQSGNVWCTEQNMFQQTTGAADMIADLHAVVTGEADGKTQLTYLHRVQ